METIHWGILGTAAIATKVCRAIQRTQRGKVHAIASRDPDRARAWASQHSVPVAHGSYQALLDDPAIQAVYIPLPPSLHREWTIRTAEQRKHVLCEKPLAATTAQAIEMADACRQHQVQLMDCVMWVHHPRTRLMREHLERGELGRLQRVTSAFSFHWDPFPENNIRLKPELAGGSLGDLGYYCIRSCLWAFDHLPLRVHATARYHNDVDVNLSAILWFRDDRVATFDCGFDTAMRKWFELAGTRGSLVCDDFVLPRSDAETRYWVHDEEGNPTVHIVGANVQEVSMVDTFHDSIGRGRWNDDWPGQSIQTMRVCDAVAQSAREKRIVDIVN